MNTINIRNLAAFENRIASLNRRAKRLGASPVTFAVERSFPQTVRVYNIEEGVRHYSHDETVQTHDVTVTGGESAVKLNGWAFLARLTPMDGGNQIAGPASDTALPDIYRTCAITCEHCKTARRRNDSFVLKHDSGAFKQVGRSCLVDFLGNVSGDNIAARFEFMNEVDALCANYEKAEGEAWEGGGEHTYDLTRLIAAALNIHGGKYISKKAEREDYSGATTATATALMMAFDDPKVSVEPTDAEVEKAEAMIAEVIATLTPSSDYAHNVLLIARAGYCTRKSFGIAVSLIACYNRLRTDAVRKEEAAASEWVGAEGERRQFTAKLVTFYDIDGQYGMTRICILRTEEGAVLKANNINVEVGDTVTFKATVKAHAEYKGTKQTVLARPAKQEVIARAA